jgi:phasin
MTEQHDATSTPGANAGSAYESIVKTLSNFQDKLEIPEGAREFVKRSAATAKDRAADMHSGATKAAGAVEGAIITTVTGVADLNRQLIQAAYQDAEAALSAIDKLAGAKSVGEAYQTQVDYVRERGEVAMARAKSVAEFVSHKVSSGVKSVQEQIAKVVPVGPQTA